LCLKGNMSYLPFCEEDAKSRKQHNIKLPEKRLQTSSEDKTNIVLPYILKNQCLTRRYK